MNIEDLLPFYALDALSDEERDFVDAWLVDHPETKNELDEMMAAVTQLPESVEPIVPSTDIKDSLMSRVAADSRAADYVADTPAPIETTQKKSFWEAMGWRPSQAAFAALGFALAAFVFAYSINLQRENQRLRLQTAEQSVEIAQQQTALTEREILLVETQQQLEINKSALAAVQQDLQANEAALIEAQEQLSLSEGALGDIQDELASLRADNARLIGIQQELEQQITEDDLLLAVFTAPNWQTAGIAGTEFDEDARGHLVHNPDDNQAVLSVSHLEPLSAEFTYQFWLIGADGPIDAGTFEQDETGDVIHIFDLETLSGFNAIGVSIEPAGGSEQPTGNIVMLGELDS